MHYDHGIVGKVETSLAQSYVQVGPFKIIIKRFGKCSNGDLTRGKKMNVEGVSGSEQRWRPPSTTLRKARGRHVLLFELMCV